MTPMWTRAWIRLVLAIVLFTVPASSASAQVVVDFPDPNLEAAIRDAIAKPTGPIYDTDLAGLTHLSRPYGDISDLTGLEYCGDLTYLELFSNQISDISALAGLTNLTQLRLDDNQISDISALGANTGIGESDYVHLRLNPLDCLSILIDIPKLLARGASVYWDDDPSCHVDTDSNGVPDPIDDCDIDTDSDGVCDPIDNCSAAPNASQLDSDSDGFGNQCDCDYDGDGFCGHDDFLTLGGNFGQSVPPAPAVADQDGSLVIDGPDFMALGGGLYQPPGPSCEYPKGTPCP
jgi:hypothetical protein